MLEQARSLAQNGVRRWLRFGHGRELTAADVKVARKYIAGYWAKLERYHPKDTGSVLGLPKPYLVPAYEDGH